jgi:two-component system, sensor histidine kinase and response regulator
MKVRQLYISNNLKPKENTAFGIKKSPKLSDKSVVIYNTSKAAEKHFILRLQEMEELNAQLEILIERQTKELADVTSTNAKFISIVAHDLRSPFGSILGALELLKGKMNDYHIMDIERYINTATNSANRALSLIESLMEWVISQNKEKSFNPIKINLYKLIEDEYESIHVLARLKQIRLNHFIEPALNISADLQMVKTIFRNLISNAIKYTNNNGEIIISASEIGQFVEITVKDNGIGISYKVQSELFKMETFHSTAGTNNEQGTGLGLLLCKEFVEIHGGKIRIESEPGKGSKFKVTLPHYL